MWNKEEKKFLMENYTHLTDVAIAKKIGKTPYAVKKMRQRSNLPKQHKTKESTNMTNEEQKLATAGWNVSPESTFIEANACSTTGTPSIEESAQADLKVEDRDISSILTQETNE